MKEPFWGLGYCFLWYVTAAQAKVATTDVKAVDIGVNASAGVDARGVQVHFLNGSAKLVKSSGNSS